MSIRTHKLEQILLYLTEFLPEFVLIDNADVIVGMLLLGESLNDVLLWAINNPDLPRILLP